jgi:S-formylglutathione hydrolase FrmB
MLIASMIFAGESAVRESTPEGAVVEHFQLASASMNRNIEVSVLLPPDRGKERFPVLYALHGRKASHLTVRDMLPLRRFLLDHPMILVTFQADMDSCYVDAEKRKGSFFTKFFFEELLPEIARRYPVDGQQAVTGFSMGGYGAMHYLLSNPGIFSSASSVSGATDLFEADAGDPDRTEWLKDLLGPRESNSGAYARLEIAPRLERAVKSGLKLPPLSFFCGSSDYLLESNLKFISMLRRVNAETLAKVAPELDSITNAKEKRNRIEAVQRAHLVDFEYREKPGGHDWLYWQSVFGDIAEFHWKCFQTKTR